MIPSAVLTPEEHAAWGALEQKMSAVLAERRAQFKLPDLAYVPADDGVLVFRMQAQEQVTEGGIVLPDHTIAVEADDSTPPWMLQRTRQVAHEKIVSLGLILDAGCAARDWMRAHGIFVGDIIKFSKYAGEENSIHWLALSGKPIAADGLKDFLQINHADIQGSFDLAARVRGGDMQLMYVSDGAGNGLHIYKPTVKETADV